MNIAYLNGNFLPKEEIKISPDDRGFLFADGIYEVMKWYGGFFYDSQSHTTRLKRSLREIQLKWDEADTFISLSNELIKLNSLNDKNAMVYIQVTRGAAPRTHHFPDYPVRPTVYAFAKELPTSKEQGLAGIGIMLKEDIRWTRCDIKSVSLLPNVLGMQEANENGFAECIFARNGFITEGSHSNIFFVHNGILRTHQESEFILSGVTRKNVIRMAKKAGIPLKEEALHEKELINIEEAFITNSTGEITPVNLINEITVGNGFPGAVTSLLINEFRAEIASLKV